MKLIRFVFYYIGYFVVGIFLVGAVAGDGLSDGAALFLLIAPAVLAMMHERNRGLKQKEKALRAEMLAAEQRAPEPVRQTLREQPKDVFSPEAPKPPTVDQILEQLLQAIETVQPTTLTLQPAALSRDFS